MNNTKKCSKCQEEKNVNEFYYHKMRKHYMSSCKKCNTKECNTYQRKQKKEKNIKFIANMRAVGITRHCRNKNIKFSDNLRDLIIQQWEKQKGLCFYSGRQMSISGDYHTNLDAMTIDKVNPSLGYVEGNIVMCCRIFNCMKQNLTYDEFMTHCKEVLEYNKI